MASEGLETDIINCLISGLVSVLNSAWDPFLLGTTCSGSDLWISPALQSLSVFEMKPTPEEWGQVPRRTLTAHTRLFSFSELFGIMTM